MLQVQALRKSYGDVAALRGLDLAIAPGEICGLLGPNGAGKTTLVSIVAGLRKADGGTVHVGGFDTVRQTEQARSMIGLAPQDVGVYPTLTVRENLECFGSLHDVSPRDLGHRIAETADAFELGPLLDRTTRELSGGERRRVHAAAAVLHRPRLLLLDEPTTGVDVRTRARLLEAVRMLAAEHGTAVCYSTHYLPEVETLGATVAIVDHGVVVARGTLRELIDAHGQATVDLVFDGTPPTVPMACEVNGSLLRIPTTDPATTAAQVLTALGADAARLRTIELRQADLESVFLAHTGRRSAIDGALNSDSSVRSEAVA